MAEGRVKNTELAAIAAAIRSQNGASTVYKPAEMAQAILDIPTGGSAVIESKSITANGTYTAPAGVDGYNPVVVAVQPNLQSKTATENGTVTPDSGYDGLSSVVVNVSGGGGGRFPNDCPCSVYTKLTESSMTITLNDTSIVFYWHGGNTIGANCWLSWMIPADLKKIKYHVEIGTRSYNNYSTYRFRPSVGVKGSIPTSGPGPNDSDWLAQNVYSTAGYVGDDELDLTSVTGPFCLILCSHGCDSTFSNFEFVFG